MTLRQLWDEGDKHYGTIRDLVFTQPLSLDQARFLAADHYDCVLGKCQGKSSNHGREIFQKIVAKEIEQFVAESEPCQALLRKFYSVQGDTVGVRLADVG